MSELFEQLPEVGDPDKPKFVMFFDEAHLLFDGAPSVLVDKVEQVVRLIRSKGVDLFCDPKSIRFTGYRVRAIGEPRSTRITCFTPRDQKAVKSAAETFRSNPAVNVVGNHFNFRCGPSINFILR